jgi:hypothetical protein
MSIKKMLDKPEIRSHRFLMLLLTIAVFGVFFYVAENTAYLNEGRRAPLLNTEFWYAFAAAMFLGIVYLIAAFRYYHVRPNWFILTLSVIFAIGGTCAALLFSGVTEGVYLIYMPTAMEKARSVGGVLVEALGVYLVFAIMPQVLRGRMVFKIFSFCYVLVIFVAIFYSYFHESEIYGFLFNNGYFRDPYYVPQSWTTNRNVYGMMIFMGIICECYLHEQNPHWWRWFIVLFFGLNEIVILSKTVLVVTAFFIPVYYIYRVITVFKKHKVRDILTAIMTAGITLAVTIMYFNGTVNAYSYEVARIFGSLVTTLEESSDRSFSVRVEIWAQAYTVFRTDNTALLFGWGEYLWQGAINAIFKTSFMPCDSTYVTTLFKYGYLGMAVFASLLGYLVFRIVQIALHGDPSGHFFAIYGIAYLAFSITESHLIMGFGSQSLMLFMTLILPVLISREGEKRQTLVHEELSPSVTAKTKILLSKVFPGDIYQRSLIWLTPIFMILITLGYSFSSAFYGFSFCLTPLAVAAFSAFYLTLPFFISSIFAFWRYGQKKKAFWLIFSMLATLGVLMVGLFVHEVGFYCVFGLTLLWMITLIFLRVLPPWQTILKRSWLLWIVYFASLAINIYTVLAIAPFTPDIAYSLLGIDVLLFAFAMVAKPHPGQADWYYLAHWDRLEKWYSRVDAWQMTHDPTTIV